MATEDEEPREAVENRGRPVGLNPGVSGITLNQGAPHGQAQAEGELPAESCWHGHRRTLGRRRLQDGTGVTRPRACPRRQGHGRWRGRGRERKDWHRDLHAEASALQVQQLQGTETLRPPPTGPHRLDRAPPSDRARAPVPQGPRPGSQPALGGTGGTSRSLVSLGSGRDARVCAERTVARVCLVLSRPPTLTHSQIIK